jgi:sugar/nucleoside kinase (ribokinase family)
VLLINEGESKLLTGCKNAIAAAEKIFTMGPKTIVIKRGEYGFVLYNQDGYFILPAFPIGNVVDPTGAGDSFAGGFFGYLAQQKSGITTAELKKACVMGCVVASFTIQAFGVGALSEATLKDVEARLDRFESVVSME